MFKHLLSGGAQSQTRGLGNMDAVSASCVFVCVTQPWHIWCKMAVVLLCYILATQQYCNLNNRDLKKNKNKQKNFVKNVLQAVGETLSFWCVRAPEVMLCSTHEMWLMCLCGSNRGQDLIVWMHSCTFWGTPVLQSGVIWFRHWTRF